MDKKRRPFRSGGGFTLAELLVVVAIIGILVAVSIPIFTAQRKKAILATNQANARAAKAWAVSLYLTGDKADQDCLTYVKKACWYDISTGNRYTGTISESSTITGMFYNPQPNYLSITNIQSWTVDTGHKGTSFKLGDEVYPYWWVQFNQNGNVATYWVGK